MVCRGFRPEANQRARVLTRVTFGEHTVVLCETHRRIAENHGVTTFEALRALYGERGGKRSFVPRRTDEESEPSTSDRRRHRGRRSTD